ncbi:putative NADPH-quinone reductase [Kaistia hirudinis]|uniref:Putative NADPH-quinone reductase n=1 Tax=Kaistia hirudinis TaxID=1293440 RepID=A0A840AQN5_9HYPH|nr:NAD(P)H-dependent oxidoreductase [Kaistia hirudinis]MBB3931598.1 putative NADPH-quinone reductase [Kaistia hirudinis]
MRALVVYAHPVPESFGAAVRDTVVAALGEAGHDVRLVDLNAIGFNPVMSADERRHHFDQGVNEVPVADQIEHIKWCEMLVFVYPTWWYGLPAILKGWLDRVWVPHVAFLMPAHEGQNIRPAMQHIRRIVVVTTCGANWWLSKWVGEPGRRTLLRGIRTLAHPLCKTLYLAHYKMDSSTPESRARYLTKVRKRLARL